MIRAAFKMKLKPEFEEEYKKRHDEIWPELIKALEEAGVFDYSISVALHKTYLQTFTG